MILSRRWHCKSSRSFSDSFGVRSDDEEDVVTDASYQTPPMASTSPATIPPEDGLFLSLNPCFQTVHTTLHPLDGTVSRVDVLPMTIQSVPVVLVLLEVVLQDLSTLLVLLAELDLQVISLEGSQLMSYDEQLADLTLASNSITLDSIRIIIAVEWRIAGVVWLRRSLGASQSRTPIFSRSYKTSSVISFRSIINRSC